MTTTSERFYVYLQRPDSHEWVTVGRYEASPDAADIPSGVFQYAPSYVRAGLAWPIDPVGLPFIPGKRFLSATGINRPVGVGIHRPVWRLLP